jgi:hypothetical protein
MDLTLDRAWTYEGYHGCESRCRLQVYEEAGFPPVIVATELDDNPGTSVTNMAEYLAAAAVGRLFPRCFEDPAGFCWVERYPAGVHRLDRRESLSIVTFQWKVPRLVQFHKPRPSMGQPKWQYIKRPAFETIIGRPYPEPEQVDWNGNPVPRGVAVVP